jgi:ABC-type transport system substrate-binding protein
VREAISLAIDRDAINETECRGMGVVDGNWINNDVEYGMDWPKWTHEPRQGEAIDGRGRVSERLCH